MSNVIHMTQYKQARIQPMIDMINNIVHEDPELFYGNYDCPRLIHVIKNAPFLTFHDCLLSYSPHDSQPFTEDKRPDIIFDIGAFRHEQPLDYSNLLELYKRAKLATIKAVTKRWAEENPLDYIDFLNSGLSIFEYAKKFDKHKPKIKASTKETS